MLNNGDGDDNKQLLCPEKMEKKGPFYLVEGVYKVTHFISAACHGAIWAVII